MEAIEEPGDPSTVLEAQEGSRLRGQRPWVCSKPFMASEASRVTPHLISYSRDVGSAARAWSREGFRLFCLVVCMHIALWARSHGVGTMCLGCRADRRPANRVLSTPTCSPVASDGTDGIQWWLCLVPLNVRGV